MSDYYQGWKDAIEAATRHAKVATDLAELVEGRLPALLACVPSRPGGFFSTTGELTWTPLSQPLDTTPSPADAPDRGDLCPHCESDEVEVTARYLTGSQMEKCRACGKEWLHGRAPALPPDEVEQRRLLQMMASPAAPRWVKTMQNWGDAQSASKRGITNNNF